METARWHRQQFARLGSRVTDEERERVGLLEWYYYGDARRVGLPTGRGSCAVGGEGGGPEAPLEPVDGGREPCAARSSRQACRSAITTAA